MKLADAVCGAALPGNRTCTLPPGHLCRHLVLPPGCECYHRADGSCPVHPTDAARRQLADENPRNLR